MNRPAWTVSEASQHTGASASTLRRALRAEKIQGAYKDSTGAWRMPIEGLIAAGYPPRSGARALEDATPTPAHGEDLAQRVRDLEADLRVAHAQKAAAEVVAHAHQQRAEAAERALRLLEGRQPGGQPPPATDHGHGQPTASHDQPPSTSAQVTPSAGGQPPPAADHGHGQPTASHPQPEAGRPRRSWWTRLLGR